jgi:multiple sugar transport system ATP-binding protein
MASIRIDHVTKRFGDVVAVDDCNLQIDDGEFVALLGPSGCGKTTTMNLISGLEKPTRGEIFVDERPISRVAPGERNIGFVFQNYAIFTHMTVFANLAFGLRVRRPRPTKAEIESAVKQVAATVGVEPLLERKAGRLSVNDMQKVALGRSMITRPAIFLLDEPFSNLDAAFRAYMRAELKRIHHEIGQTTIYVTHDQVEAMSMADRIAVMNLGVLQQVGSPLEIYNGPANLFVAGFLGSVQINFLPAELIASADGHNGRKLTFAIRPEHVRLTVPDGDQAVLRAEVRMVEPLGSKDIVHLTFDDRHELRAIGRPGARPHIGEHVGLAFDGTYGLYFDDETGLAVT